MEIGESEGKDSEMGGMKKSKIRRKTLKVDLVRTSQGKGLIATGWADAQAGGAKRYLPLSMDYTDLYRFKLFCG